MAEFAKLLDIAKSSCGEVRSMYCKAEDLGYVPVAGATWRREKAKQIAAGIASLGGHLDT